MKIKGYAIQDINGGYGKIYKKYNECLEEYNAINAGDILIPMNILEIYEDGNYKVVKMNYEEGDL